MSLRKLTSAYEVNGLNTRVDTTDGDREGTMHFLMKTGTTVREVARVDVIIVWTLG